ncbi:MAG: trypsin-like peptidase domain-containing protein [Phycisphaerales bacterium]|nr:trypsin-like peptidase domain-containing protein [Phycisphaerales bacterium]
MRRRVFAFVWGALFLAAGQAGAQQRLELADLKQLQQAFCAMAEEHRPSVVAIRTYDLVTKGPRNKDEPKVLKKRDNHGTGFILSPDGLILTNNHVVRGAGHILAILYDGREFEAVIRGADVRSDLAVLKIDAEHLKAVRLGDADQVKVGQWSVVIGSPFGLAAVRGESSVTFGTVSALGRDLTGDLTDGRTANVYYYGGLIETSAAVNPGNSGGPLFTLEGDVIGVVTAIASRSGVSEGLGFAVPVDRFTKRLLDEIREGREFHYGYLGIQPTDDLRSWPGPRPVEPPRHVGGALIGYVEPGQPAAIANLRENDRIVSFNGELVRNSDHLVRLVGFTPPGTKAPVRFLRDGETRDTLVEVADRELSTRKIAEREE